MGVKIVGVGSFIPEFVRKNSDFLNHHFYTNQGEIFDDEPDLILKKFEKITGIEERRYVEDHLTVSDIAVLASKKAIADAKINPETLDYIIFAHNFGDVKSDSNQTDIVPSLAARVKHQLKIKNPDCSAYDMIFGCPGWVESCIHAKAFIEAGMAKNCLVIGAETLSRVVDPHDRDSMIYADGAGATVLSSTDEPGGIMAHATQSHTYQESNYIYFERSFNPSIEENTKYIKMHGRKIYNFALTHVPQAMKKCLDESGFEISQLKKIFIHQANEKMDEAIVSRFYQLYNFEKPDGVMPMSIKNLGNSSVATIPTLYDLYLRGEFGGNDFEAGDVIMFASVGAGMNINAIIYQY
ncbi:3-oxoacyl-ACP synthase III family protein [Psychroflexus maritimus]|uniref:Ketoacyl-ACP synthase III n=1 Tax=Psychroflexus maritimus TaxID=2714865 RepID=A0A967DYK9_9FLAO|nr:ketoacyl-ACP synthase III [Psychroflexus maritimus]NGZ89930.1 ketoacyl-ACP synthase III [Psychroflexus maritimus]